MITEKELSGVEKAAVLLLSLGEELASEIMKHLGPEEVQKLIDQMTKMDGLSQESFTQVAGEFQKEMESTIVFGGKEYVKKIVTKALGPEKASSILDRMVEAGEGNGLRSLRMMEPHIVADLIKNEHPQTIAVIMAHLEPEQASQVMTHLPANLRADVVMRIATMESVTPEALHELEEAITMQLSGSTVMHSKNVGGIKTAAEILNHLDSSNESAIISEIEKANSEIAAKIQEQMFVFADLVHIDDRGIQEILKEVSNDLLVLALKVADDNLKEKIFKNMSSRARDMLKEDMETRGPVRLSEVEKAQQEIVKIARQLEQEGRIMIGGKGGGEVLV